MNPFEINEKNHARLQGQAGVYRVASELLLRGFNPQFPAVDCGADLVIEGGVRVQVKCAHFRTGCSVYPQGAYWFKLARCPVAKNNHEVRPRAPKEFTKECEFVIFWGIEENRFWVVPADLVEGRHLLVLGPDVAWVEANVAQIRELYEAGHTKEEIGKMVGMSGQTVARRLRGQYVTANYIRSMTHQVKACEGAWDSLRGYVNTLIQAVDAVTTARKELECQVTE